MIPKPGKISLKNGNLSHIVLHVTYLNGKVTINTP